MRTAILCLLAASASFAASTADYYAIGSPGPLEDIYVAPSGNNTNSGSSPAAPVLTLAEAWSRATNLIATGYRIMLLPGTYPFDGLNYFADRAGSAAHPLFIVAANGTTTATVNGGLNLAHNRYLYLLDLTLVAGGAAQAWGNDVLHFEDCSYVLARRLTIRGPIPDSGYEMQEVVKANQSDHLYVEECDLAGTYQTGLDWFSVQHSHVLNSIIHHTGEWGLYVKGGSAYIRVDGNLFYQCGLGIQAGEGSNFPLMQPPWIHYECYDVKVMNNVLHDINGTGLSVAGGYNILMAYNTLVHVATNAGPGHPLLQFVHGLRRCPDTAADSATCTVYLAMGGWGTAVRGQALDAIPDRNVRVVNNLFYNPAPSRTLYQQFDCQESNMPPVGSNIPRPSRCDDNLLIQGNIVWNGPTDHPLGMDNATSISESQLRAENAINTIEPKLASLAAFDFRPVEGGAMLTASTYAITDFTWADAPSNPPVPAGNISNTVATDFNGIARSGTGPAGAFVTTVPEPAAAAAVTGSCFLIINKKRGK